MAKLSLAAALAMVVVVGCGDDATMAETDIATTTIMASTGGMTGEDPGPTTGDVPMSSSTMPEPTTTTTSESTTTDPEETSTTEPLEEPVGGVFLAVGDGGRRARSVDGEVWEQIVGTGVLDTNSDEAAPDALRALAFGDGVVVAVGGGGTFHNGNSMVMRSEDLGETWQEDVLAGGIEGVTPRQLYGVAYANGVFVAAGLRGQVLRSVDAGLTWTSHSPNDGNARLLAVAAEGSTFVVAGWADTGYDTPKTSFLYASSDGGNTWNDPDKSGPRLADVAAGNGMFVAVGSDHCRYASDGVQWTECDVQVSGVHGIEFVQGQFLLIHDAGLVVSKTGTTWTTATRPELGTPTSIAYGSGRFAGVRWTERGWSDDLLIWNLVTHAAEPLRAIVYITP